MAGTVRLEATVEIGAAASTIFEVLSDARRLPEWSESVVAARRLDEGPVGVGSRAAMRGRVVGQTIEGENQVVAYEPPRRFATRSIRGPRLSTEFTLQSVAFGTVVTVVMDGEVPGGRLGAAVAKGVLAADLRRSLARLRELCEAEAKRAATDAPLEGGDPACWIGEHPDLLEAPPEQAGNEPG